MKNWTSNAKNIRSLGIIAAVLSCSIATSASIAQSTWTYVSGYHTVMFGTLYLFTLLGLVMHILGDVMYTVVDPRIDFESRG